MSDYKLNPADFLDEADMKAFQYYMDHPGAVLMEMANVRGNKVLEGGKKLPFSFYMSDKKAVHQVHGIRIKIFWNSNRVSGDADGYMELHGDYNYVQSSKNRPSSKDLAIAKEFFRKYKVLFAAIWERVLDSTDVQSYLYGEISFKQLLGCFWFEDFPNNRDSQLLNFARITHCTSLEDLEKCVRRFNIFNMND